MHAGMVGKFDVGKLIEPAATLPLAAGKTLDDGRFRESMRVVEVMKAPARTPLQRSATTAPALSAPTRQLPEPKASAAATPAAQVSVARVPVVQAPVVQVPAVQVPVVQVPVAQASVASPQAVPPKAQPDAPKPERETEPTSAVAVQEQVRKRTTAQASQDPGAEVVAKQDSHKEAVPASEEDASPAAVATGAAVARPEQPVPAMAPPVSASPQPVPSEVQTQMPAPVLTSLPMRMVADVVPAQVEVASEPTNIAPQGSPLTVPDSQAEAKGLLIAAQAPVVVAGDVPVATAAVQVKAVKSNDSPAQHSASDTKAQNVPVPVTNTPKPTTHVPLAPNPTRVSASPTPATVHVSHSPGKSADEAVPGSAKSQSVARETTSNAATVSAAQTAQALPNVSGAEPASDTRGWLQVRSAPDESNNIAAPVMAAPPVAATQPTAELPLAANLAKPVKKDGETAKQTAADAKTRNVSGSVANTPVPAQSVTVAPKSVQVASQTTPVVVHVSQSTRAATNANATDAAKSRSVGVKTAPETATASDVQTPVTAPNVPEPEAANGTQGWLQLRAEPDPTDEAAAPVMAASAVATPASGQGSTAAAAMPVKVVKKVEEPSKPPTTDTKTQTVAETVTNAGPSAQSVAVAPNQVQASVPDAPVAAHAIHPLVTAANETSTTHVHTAAVGVGTSAEVHAGSDLQTLVATPNVLEIGVASGTHGWLRVRAELGQMGEVTASVAAASAGAAEGLHKELPALSAYLASERVAVNSLVVNAMDQAAGAQDSAAARQSGGESGSAPGASADAQAGQDHRSGRPQAEAMAGTNAMDSVARVDSGASALPAAVYAGASGSWLSVRV